MEAVRLGRDRSHPSANAGLLVAPSPAVELNSSRPEAAASVLAPAVVAENAFVFEDRSGRRWLRVKGTALVLGGLLAATAVTLLLAVLLVAPGRAQSPPVPPSTPEQLQPWSNPGAGAQPAVPQQPAPSGEEELPLPSPPAPGT
jgi:hypothetical protein